MTHFSNTAIILVILVETVVLGGIYYTVSVKYSADGAEIVEPVPAKAAEGELNCLQCHYLEYTKKFHDIQTVIKIENERSLPRRICIDCHASSHEAGANGVFKVPSQVVHAIHAKKLDSKEMTCDACHLSGDELYIPKADAARGQVLVCQNCMAHPEEGNYIMVHIEKGCTTCHAGMHNTAR